MTKVTSRETELIPHPKYKNNTIQFVNKAKQKLKLKQRNEFIRSQPNGNKSIMQQIYVN